MTARADSLLLPASPSLWRRHAGATLLAAGATIALGCGLSAAALHGGIAPSSSAMVTLFAVTVWIGLSAGPLAAGADDWFGALCRGGILADASVVTLVMLGLTGDGVVGWRTGVEVYLLWLAMAVAASMATQLGSSPASRGAIGAGVASLAALAMAGLFWSPGLLAALAEPWRGWALRGLFAWNPLMGVVDACGTRAGFVWPQQPVMYFIARVGQDYPPPSFAWWMPAVGWGCLAGLLAGLLGARGAYRRIKYGT